MTDDRFKLPDDLSQAHMTLREMLDQHIRQMIQRAHASREKDLAGRLRAMAEDNGAKITSVQINGTEVKIEYEQPMVEQLVTVTLGPGLPNIVIRAPEGLDVERMLKDLSVDPPT